ncbi:DUF4215 domain-containing protein [Nannocystis sp. SCPEA4]|uniref:outer membrane protein assembly factor BamB family protein n=1 Tax=Nannocystis sp. SCPEA4 TaxID=2996787 RepID=UPI00226DF9FE|nr:DUF4215 domain-containing protein [Nannocystis sp. SCPEA4]MCY1062801.1 hypothetical protein [Nannocystis sp. SCPEA4]
MSLWTCLSVLVACDDSAAPGWTFGGDAWASTGTTGDGPTSVTEASPLTPTTTDGPTTGAPLTCGDGVIDPGEVCDDGNLEPDDGCDAACMPIAAVEWTYTHNGGAGKDDVASGVAIDRTGRVFVVGAEVVQSRDALIVALAPDGAELWRKTIDSSGFEDAFVEVAVDGNNHVYAAGYEEIAAGVKAAVIRGFSADGEDLWKFSEAPPAAGLSGIDGLALGDGALYSTGSEDGPDSRLVVRRHEIATGAAVWKTSTQADASAAFAGGIAVWGPHMIAVGSALVGTELHPLIVQVTHTGEVTWTAVESRHRGAWSDAAAIGNAGDVVLAGRLEPVDGQGFDVAVRRITVEGAAVWAQTIDHVAGFDDGRGVAVGAGQAIFVAGAVTTSSGDSEIFGARLSGAGERRWTHVNANRGVGLDDHGTAAAFGPGFIVLAGDAQVAGEGANVWVRRFSAE